MTTLDLTELTPEQAELQGRARRFVEEVLIPLEEQAERRTLPDDAVARIKSEAIAAELHGGLHAREHGGQGWTKLEWVLVEEQLGRSTNALSWHIPTAYNVLASGSPEQIDRWLRPSLRGERHDAYAVTEEHAGSDPSGIATTARRSDGGWVIDGEKWFVTYGDIATVYIVVANAEGEGPTLFLVDATLPGISVVDDPPFTHTYPHGHPTIRFDGRRGARRGRHRRRRRGRRAPARVVHRGAPRDRGARRRRDVAAARRGDRVGADARAGRRAGSWTTRASPSRLADSAADAAAGRALMLQVARLIDAGADPKIVHAKASMAKLFVSEAACRCADRAVQVFGGRGYLRTNVAERFLRELRVDRIWEGTSEIQRLIVARALERRGVERTLH